MKILVSGLVVTRKGPLLAFGVMEGRLEPTGSGSEQPGFRMGLHHIKP